MAGVVYLLQNNTDKTGWQAHCVKTSIFWTNYKNYPRQHPAEYFWSVASCQWVSSEQAQHWQNFLEMLQQHHNNTSQNAARSGCMETGMTSSTSASKTLLDSLSVNNSTRNQEPRWNLSSCPGLPVLIGNLFSLLSASFYSLCSFLNACHLRVVVCPDLVCSQLYKWS